MSEVALVFVTLKRVGERQRIVFLHVSKLPRLPPEIVLRVANIRSNSVPAPTFSFTVIGAVAKYFHSIVVQTVWLAQVQNIKTNFLARLSVTAAEKVPLSVAVRVDVVLKNQVIFAVGDFHRSQQVAGLKARLEH